MAKETQGESERSGVERMAKNGFQDYIRIRTLENTCAILNDFLKPAMNVLDIGCGPGTITLDVARKLSHGSVTGVDLNEDALKNARKVAIDAGLSNIEFKAGDTYSLEFSDKTFDLIYSHALFEWLQEPVKALREQARVTRTGGWVIAMVSSWDYIVLYPECPELRRIIIALRALKKAPEDVGFLNIFAPHEAVGFLIDAGYRNYKIISFTPNLQVAYPGSEYFDYCYHTFQLFGSADLFGKWHEYFLDKGLIDRDTIKRAMAELEVWYHHPHALFIHPSVAACGQVD